MTHIGKVDVVDLTKKIMKWTKVQVLLLDLPKYMLFGGQDKMLSLFENM